MTGLTKSGIPYLIHDCKAVRGCTPCSEACDNCWAAANAWRMAHHPNAKIRERFQGLAMKGQGGVARFTGEVRTDEDALRAVLRLRKPSVIGMCFGGDLFHPKVDRAFIDQTMVVMGMCWGTELPEHAFIVPSKRAGLMAGYLTARPDLANARRALGAGMEWAGHLINWSEAGRSNVIFMVTVWDQDSLDAAEPYIRAMLDMGARVALSYEPALGPMVIPDSILERLAWVVAGCEQLPGGRPGRKAVEVNSWMYFVERQCTSPSNVPYYTKQRVEGCKVAHLAPKDYELPKILRPFFKEG